MPLKSRTTISLQWRSAATFAAANANFFAFKFLLFAKFYILIVKEKGAADSATP